MDRISILDCTLRDGGYVNDFQFGEQAIHNIICKLSKAAIDIIECGFLQTKGADSNQSLFNSIEEIGKYIGIKNQHLMYVAMIQYGAISIDEISPRHENSVDGIRLTFHEHEIDPAFMLGRQLMDKGYKVFMQPVGTMTYTDEALLKLIKRINQLKPYAFYVVDTLGTMYKNDLLRMFYLIDHNLSKKIVLGFHSHNNLQLSFANAQELIQLNTPRSLIIDSSVYGIGRGAGNLNTELMTQYINMNFNPKYDNLEILEIIDEYIKPLSMKYNWGYDAAYYLASIKGCHPNYASYLLNRQTLHVKDINAILNNLDFAKRKLFDSSYILEEYTKYQSHHYNDIETIKLIKERIYENKVLIIAPGKTVSCQVEEIRKKIRNEKIYVVCVNFVPEGFPCDMVFVSNIKRFKKVSLSELGIFTVITSNIHTAEFNQYYMVDYSSYLNEESCISDNAGLMCINLMKKAGAKNILLAGFDGFSMDVHKNYYDHSYVMDVGTEYLEEMNAAIKSKIKQLKSQINLEFLTKSIYE